NYSCASFDGSVILTFEHILKVTLLNYTTNAFRYQATEKRICDLPLMLFCFSARALYEVFPAYTE
ncbi:MAG TPA: hypothetical protein VKZ68_10925, partial [Ohtaekwangia sp.]|nr:hypothetical protein [Ohtaekwangia sp.]